MAVALHQIKTQILSDVCGYLQAEVESCDGGIKPEDKPAFEALLRMVERELWKRPLFRKAWRKARCATNAKSRKKGAGR